jgi:hypothetical protein
MYLLDIFIIVMHINFLYTSQVLKIIHPNTIMETIDAIFFEDVFPFKEA